LLIIIKDVQINWMLAPEYRLKLSEKLAKAAMILGSLTVGIMVFLALNYAVLGFPEVVFGHGVMLTTGYLLYVGVRVAGVAVAALFYLYFGDAITNSLRKKMVSPQHLVLIIAGIATILYIEYTLL
jgi:hypothetical protein